MQAQIKKLIILLLFVGTLAIGAGDYEDGGDFDVADDILIIGDENELVWYNWDTAFSYGGTDFNTVSIRASGQLEESYLGRMPINSGEPNSVLMTPGDIDSQWVWAQIDGDLVDINDSDPNIVIIGLPTKTPWNVMFVDVNGYPLTDDPNDFTYYQPERAFGIGMDSIAGRTYADNLIEVYSLLWFDPNTLSTSIGWGGDHTMIGPNNVRIGFGAGKSLTVGEQNTTGGRSSGEAIVVRDNNSFWGFESGKNVGGGSLSNPMSDYKYTYISENGSIWGVPVGDGVITGLDASGVAVDIGGGIVGLPFADHPFNIGEKIRISNTTNYNGFFTLGAGTTADQLQITDTFNAETFDGTEIVVRNIANLSAGGGRMVQDSNGNLYYGHNWDNGTYVTKIEPDGTEVYDFLNHSWGGGSGKWCAGLAITPDDQYLYLWIWVDAITDHGFMSKWELSTGDMVWGEIDVTWPRYNMAIDADGNAYACHAPTTGTLYRFASDDGTATEMSVCYGSYDVLVDDDLGIVINPGWGSGGNTNLWVRTLDDSTGDTMAVGGDGGWIIGTGSTAVKGGYIYVISETPTPTLYKIQWDGSELVEIDSVAGPTYGVGLYFDLYDNLVVVNQNWNTNQDDILWYYDTDLNFITAIEGMYSSMLNTWASNVGGAWIQGNAVFYPGITSMGEEGHGNTAIASQALRGAAGGAEPNEAAAGGYKSMFNVSAGDLSTGWGSWSLYSLTTGSRDAAFGPYAGYWLTTEDDKFVVDSRRRTNAADEIVSSILYGHTADDANDQWLNINADVNMPNHSLDVNDITIEDIVISGLTADSVLFVDANGALSHHSQDNVNFRFIDANDYLILDNLFAKNVAVLSDNSAIFQPNADSTAFFQIKNAAGTVTPFNVDTANNQVTIGKSSSTYPFVINSTDGSDQISIYHDNTTAFISWTDGVIRFRSVESTNADSILDINAQGTGNAILQLQGFVFAKLDAGGSMIQTLPGATFDYTLFDLSTEGETKTFSVSGFGTGSGGRETFSLSVEKTTANTVEFEGLDAYRFLGNIITLNDTHEDTDGGRESRHDFQGEQSGGERTTLARIEVGHDGAADDEKGYLDEFINDGDDGDTPTKVRRVDSLGTVFETGPIFLKETTTPTARTNYGALYTKSDNELFFQDGAGEEHLLHGDAFSNIWFHAPSSVEVAIAVQDSLTKIDSFTVVGHEDDIGNVVGSAATDTLTLASVAGGEYEISFHGSITATGGADKEMMLALGITLATPKDITNVTDNGVSPIVITSIAHGLENGDMVEIAGVLVNTAANGSFIVDSKAADTFEIVALDAGATTGNGDYDEGTPTGDVTILYPGNMEIHRMVRGADFGSISATGVHLLAGSDVLAFYVANLSGVTNLTVSSVSLSAFRIGD